MLKAKSFSKKTRTGAVVQVRQEHYLRDDIGCGFAGQGSGLLRHCMINPEREEVRLSVPKASSCKE